MPTRLALAVAALVCGCAFAGAQAVAAPDPYSVFAKSRSYWVHQHYPQMLQYSVAVNVTENGNARVERYDSMYDAVNNAISVDPVSDYERAHPVVPTGIDFSVASQHIGKPYPEIDFLGVPRLAPNYSFGMAPFIPAHNDYDSDDLVSMVRSDYQTPAPFRIPGNPPKALPIIGTVVATDHSYHISLVGDENIDGHDCYHLALTPERDPSRYRIREAWIDRTSFAPWKLIDATNFRGGAPSTVAWTISFADVNGAHYVSHERADAPISIDGRLFSAAVVSFENVRRTGSLFPSEVIPPSAYSALTEPQ
jgi:hypothetical protein